VPEQSIAGSAALKKWNRDRATPAETRAAASLARQVVAEFHGRVDTWQGV
jgi:hypothetical protein